MNQEQLFYQRLSQVEIFSEEILCTGADINALEELIIGSFFLPSNLPCSLTLNTSFENWKKIHLT